MAMETHGCLPRNGITPRCLLVCLPSLYTRAVRGNKRSMNAQDRTAPRTPIPDKTPRAGCHATLSARQSLKAGGSSSLRASALAPHVDGQMLDIIRFCAKYTALSLALSLELSQRIAETNQRRNTASRDNNLLAASKLVLVVLRLRYQKQPRKVIASQLSGTLQDNKTEQDQLRNMLLELPYLS